MTEETKSLPPPPPPPPPPATTLSPQPTTTTQTPPTTSTPTPAPAPAPEIQSELNAAVDDLLDQLQHKFDGVSREIFGKCAFYPFPFPPSIILSYGTYSSHGSPTAPATARGSICCTETGRQRGSVVMRYDAMLTLFEGVVDDMARRLDELEASLALLDSSSAPAGAGATAEGAVAGAAGDAAGSASPGK